MSTLIEHPELIGLAAFLIPILFPFILGYLIGRERGWKKCDQRNAKLNAERDQRIAELTQINAQLGKMNTSLAQECESLGGSITRVFPGNMKDPYVLDAAFTAMTKIRRRPSGDLPDNSEERKRL